MTIKTILFDIDGTLVDSNDDHVEAWEEAFREAGHDVDRQPIRDQIGKGADMLVPALLPELDEDAQQDLGEAHGSIFQRRYLDAVVPFAGAHALLRHVRDQGQHIVLASSASKQDLDHYVELLDAKALIDVTTCGDDVENTKPAPDIFATALNKVGSAADEAMVIGDTPYDMEAAGKSGIAAIGLLSGGFDEARLRSAGAIAVYDDVAALLKDYAQSPLHD